MKELAERITRQLKIQDAAECQKLLKELQDFCAKATPEELESFRQKCPYGEAFIMLAKSFEVLK